LTDAAKLFQAIQPGLTVYGVLLTFALISFGIGKYFWEYDKTLIGENVERLKSLLEGYRRRSIEPILNKQLAAAVSAAYDGAILGLIGDIYSQKRIGPGGEFTEESVPDEELKAMLSKHELGERLKSLKRGTDTTAGGFLASTTGETLYDELDHAYARRDDLHQHYARARRACGRTAYSFLGLSFLLLAGLLQILSGWPMVVVIVWLTVAGEVFVCGLYSFVRLELSRRRLLRLWEELQIYGKI
jgi:hypothetical protein